MVSLVERMLGLHQQLTAAKISHDKTALQRQIDQLVYELYGLSEEKIKIVRVRAIFNTNEILFN
ncbi:hypothetical protein DCC62_31340 [candidate division KSB1 bacterium]|nr:MAG: hypothetical protein DCC62_31340 [candidate division KSB1 bacterium]